MCIRDSPDGEERPNLRRAHVADFAADDRAVRGRKCRQLERGKTVLKQLQHDFRRNGLPTEQRVKLVERRHHRVPDLRAVLRLRREIGGVQLVAHVFQRFIRMDAFQQRKQESGCPITLSTMSTATLTFGPMMETANWKNEA